jgi:hypothetical protein
MSVFLWLTAVGVGVPAGRLLQCVGAHGVSAHRNELRSALLLSIANQTLIGDHMGLLAMTRPTQKRRERFFVEEAAKLLGKKCGRRIGRLGTSWCGLSSLTH